MERALKERIIGAAVLVLFVVLVVPVFLDGPPEDGEIVSERVLLPGQDGQDTKTVVLDRERSAPLPAASKVNEPVAAPEIATEQRPVQEKPVPKPLVAQPSPAAAEPVEQRPVEQKPVEKQSVPPPPKPANTSATGMWAVQLGSFSNKENAEKLAADLRKQGYAAFLSQLTTDAGTLHRVRIGPQKDREAAEAMASRLAKANHKGQVLPHP